MADSVVAFLLNQLSSMLYQGYAHLGGLQQEARCIKDELGSMRAFLRDVEAKDESDFDFELQEWVKQVRGVVYDTEDAIDEFIILCSTNHQGEGFYSSTQKLYRSLKNLRARHKVSSKLKEIRRRVEYISARHQRYQSVFGTSERGTSSAPGENPECHIRGQALLLEEADLVGIEEPKSQLTLQVIDSGYHLKVISVLGMGGVGKTTLVKRVYEDANVKRKFSSHAWLIVSQNFNTVALLRNLIVQLYKEIQQEVPLEVEFMDSVELRAFVKNFLKERRYVIVLDDIWSLDAWDSIKYAMPDSNCGSRVIVTTRIADIAYTCCRECQGYIYRMKPLSDEESWTLFCNKTFEEKQCPLHLKKVSKSILAKCEGLPLAIVAIGGLLALKDNSKVDEWEMVRRGLGSELEGTGKLDRVRKILLLSYNDLPYYLKSCLLYISMYPEDYRIHAWRLVRLWVAEGFILERPGMTSIEMARSYLNKLINRSLIQVAATHADGSVHACRVHDLLREIVLFKSREHYITTVAAGWHTRWPDNVRRLAIYNFTDDQQDTIPPMHLRSLVISKYKNPLTSSSLSRFLRGGSKFLKVMDLSNAELKNIPEEVFKLFHLKYLNLAYTQVVIIPKAIGKLQNLEFLNLVGTGVKEFPIDILKLRKLQDLLVYRQGSFSQNFAVYGFNAPYEIGKLLALQYLHFIDADNDKTLKEIGKLTQLRELGITKLRKEDGKDLCSSLEKLTNLQRLVVNSIREDEVLDLQFSMPTFPQLLQLLELRGRLENIPQWLHSLQGLTVVYLYWSCLREDPLESLQDLPNLVEIILCSAYEGETLCFRAGRFQKLKILELRKLRGLKMVKFEKGTTPHLNKLLLDDCRLVEKLPAGIQYLERLEYFGLYDMANELMMKLKKNLDRNGEDYKRIAHITQIFAGYWSKYGKFIPLPLGL